MKVLLNADQELYFPDLGVWIKPGEEVDIPDDKADVVAASALLTVKAKAAKES
jgi:hypothetical protein